MKNNYKRYLTLLLCAIFHSFIIGTSSKVPKSIQPTQTLAHKLTNILSSTAPTVVKHSDGSYHVYLNNNELTSFVFDGPIATPIDSFTLKLFQQEVKDSGSAGLCMDCFHIRHINFAEFLKKGYKQLVYDEPGTDCSLFHEILLFSTPTKLSTLPIYINTSINHTLKNQNTTYKNILQKVWHLLLLHPRPTLILPINHGLYIHAGLPSEK
jgi:hypothetical protein